jgi:4-amino-4-deoxy-L-arabinose transferase-like glycosyltransferase
MPQTGVTETMIGQKPETARQRLALAILALALVVMGQLFWARSGYFLDGLGFTLAGIMLFLALVAWQEGTWPQARELGHSIRSAPQKVVLVLLSFAIGVLEVKLLKTHAATGSYWGIFALWITGIALYFLAVAQRSWPDLKLVWQRYATDVILVALLTMLAAALRFVRLGALPGTLYADEGQLGLLARSVLDGQVTNMFATAYGHSTLYLFVMAGLLKLFGINAAALRLSSALAGTLTVPIVYLFARSQFNRRVAVVAAALLAALHVHVHFSRLIIAGGIQDALFATLAFYLLVSGLEKRSRNRLLLAALTLGLHVYIYMGGRLLLLLIPLYLLVLFIFEHSVVRENARNLLASAGLLVVTLIPMALWGLTHTADFMSRLNQMGIIQTGWLAAEAVRLNQSQVQVLANAVLQAFLTIVHYPAEAFYGARLPMLDVISAAVFVLGLGYSLYRVGRREHLLLNAWLWAGIVTGGALVLFPTLAAYRILIIVPALCVFVGLGWDRLVDSGIGGPRAGILKGVFTAGFVGLLIALNVRFYFGDYLMSCSYGTWEMRFAWRMAESIKEIGSDHKAYLLGYPRIQYEPAVYPSVGFLLGQTPIADVRQPLTTQITSIDAAERAVFFLVPERESELPVLEEKLPGGTVDRIDDCGKPLITIYRVD